jgi:PAS domain S-box-containing protein
VAGVSGWERAVLQRLTEEVRECLACAAEAREKANGTRDPAIKDDFLKMEQRWLRLARSFAFAGSLKDFTAANVERLRYLDEFCKDSNKRVRARRDELRWLASIIESSDDAIISKDLNGVMMSWNAGAQRMFGYSVEEAIGKPVMILIPPDRHDEEPIILKRIRAGEKIEHYETVRRRKDGSLIEISLSVSPVRDELGTIIGASKIARDITQRKQIERQAAILGREAEHRTKNILATVSAAVELSESDTPEGLKAAIRGRIQALANARTMLVDSRWTGAELKQLVAKELSPYRTDGERALIEGPQIMLEPTVAQALAVTVHELATNAAKYGALSVPAGSVQMTWSQSHNGELSIRWLERGGPPVVPPTREGFGSRVMNSLIQQIGGTVAFDWRKAGLCCNVTIPKPQG